MQELQKEAEPYWYEEETPALLQEKVSGGIQSMTSPRNQALIAKLTRKNNQVLLLGSEMVPVDQLLGHPLWTQMGTGHGHKSS